MSNCQRELPLIAAEATGLSLEYIMPSSVKLVQRRPEFSHRPDWLHKYISPPPPSEKKGGGYETNPILRSCLRSSNTLLGIFRLEVKSLPAKKNPSSQTPPLSLSQDTRLTKQKPKYNLRPRPRLLTHTQDG
jgi:hypothetical protein